MNTLPWQEHERPAPVATRVQVSSVFELTVAVAQAPDNTWNWRLDVDFRTAAKRGISGGSGLSTKELAMSAAQSFVDGMLFP